MGIFFYFLVYMDDKVIGVLRKDKEEELKIIILLSLQSSNIGKRCMKPAEHEFCLHGILTHKSWDQY